MSKKRRVEFTKGVERLVKPVDVSFISSFNAINRLLPKQVQRKLMASTAKKVPYMGFVVEPYSLFLCHKITDIAAAKALLPDTYTLTKTSIFTDDDPAYYVIFGCFTAHTSAFWGSRIEMYIIAEHNDTGLLSWVIADYDTNTNSYDPKNGLVNANSENSVMTTTHRGEVVVDMQRDDGLRRLSAGADVTAGEMQGLDQRLWLEGNLSVDYGSELSDGSVEPFALTFDPLEVEQALRIPLKSVAVELNNWYPGLFEQEPSQVACFPYAQHFVTGSYGSAGSIKNKKELKAAVQELGDLRQHSGFSAKPLKRQMAIGMALSVVWSTGLLVYIIVHLFIFH